MAGASDYKSTVSVSSWGWVNHDGQLVRRDNAAYRLWHIMRGPEFMGFVALPPDYDSSFALVMACRMWADPEMDLDDL